MKNNNSSTFGIVAVVGIIVFTLGGVFIASQGSAPVSAGSPGTSSLAQGNYDSLLGKSAPQFNLRDREGNEYTNENTKGKKVVLFFNEGIMCYPACWNQVLSLGTDERFESPDTVAISVVTDSKDSWDTAIAKMPELAKARTVFDFDRSASVRFGMLNTPSSMHYGSLPGHTYVVLDRAGIVRYVLDDPRMAINNDLIWSEIQKIQ